MSDIAIGVIATAGVAGLCLLWFLCRRSGGPRPDGISRRGFLATMAVAAVVIGSWGSWLAVQYRRIFRGHIYANAHTGDDSNHGFTEDKPVRSLQAAFDRVPKVICRDVTVHLRGTFDGASGDMRVTASIHKGKTMTVVGDK